MIFEGEVVEGNHNAGKWITSCPGVFEAALGAPVHAGTINVAVEGSPKLFQDSRVWPTCDNMRRYGSAHLIEWTVNGVRGFILNDEYPAP